MPKLSAGLLLYRRNKSDLEVLLVHPGGPFWANKDLGAWSLPKGEFSEDDDPGEAARREFREELGAPAPDGPMLSLGTARQSSGKVIHAFAIESDFSVDNVRSNTFKLEWPKGSGTLLEFPEVDRAAWFVLSEAARKLVKGQVPLLERLASDLGHKIAGQNSPGESLF